MCLSFSRKDSRFLSCDQTPLPYSEYIRFRRFSNSNINSTHYYIYCMLLTNANINQKIHKKE
ncbi:MAG: hypothetical protein JWO73_242 [Candidatus Taylorbacteria bacterium]|nr:hypothetical protein [Candidatus Taylorbacteria bacterium]